MEATSDQARSTTEPATASTAPRGPETPAEVLQVQKRAVHQLKLGRGPTFELEHRTMEA
jgi:hypothetical protein